MSKWYSRYTEQAGTHSTIFFSTMQMRALIRTHYEVYPTHARNPNQRTAYIPCA